MMAESCGSPVTPERPLAGPRVQRTEGLFPLHPVLHRRAFDDTAAGETQERGREVGQELRELRSQTGGTVLEGLARK